jgi:hypothetical protein
MGKGKVRRTDHQSKSFQFQAIPPPEFRATRNIPISAKSANVTRLTKTVKSDQHFLSDHFTRN